MINATDQVWMRSWLCKRIGLVPTSDLKCIGNMFNNQLKGVVGYDGYNGASIQMHVAGEGNWFTKDFCFAVFHYPFVICGVNMLIGMVPSGNVDAIRFNKHIGFKQELELVGAHPDGSLILMTMTRRECRFLERTRSRRHGQEEQAAAST